MEDVIIFDKSLNERLHEYNRIFPDECLSLKHLERCWSRFLLINVNVDGWKAIWKIPRMICQHMKFPYPTFAIVSVVRVDFDEMTAEAIISAIQEDISIPRDDNPATCYSMPLIELYPIKQQEINVYNIANVLDALRFFYTHIYMPWDAEEEEGEDNWRDQHFENRLRLYYNLKNGIIPDYASKYIESLLSEVQWLNIKKKTLNTTQDCDHDSKIYQLSEIKLRLHEIRAVIDSFSDPLMLDVAIEMYFPSDAVDNPKQRTTWAISNRIITNDLIPFFERINLIYPSEELTFGNSLLGGSPGDGFLLDNSEFTVDRTILLEEGGSIKGIDLRDKIMLLSNVENIMINFMGDALIENIVINSKSTQCAVLVSSGKAILKNCLITGEGNDTTIKGIIVLEDAELELIDCELKGFYSSIVCKSHSKVTMWNCNISSSTFGVQACDNSKVTMSNVQITNCQNNGIVVETTDDVEREIGGIEILKMISGFTMENANVSGGVLLRHKRKMIQMESSLADLKPEQSAANGDE